MRETPKEKHCKKTCAILSKNINYNAMVRGNVSDRTKEWGNYRPGGIIRTSNYKKD